MNHATSECDHRSLLAERKGSMLIEFAIALPIFCLLLIGMLDLGRFAWQSSALLQGVREGAQYGLIAYADSTNINTTTQNATGQSGVTATNTVFCECVSGTTVSCSTTCGSGQTLKRYITVAATKSFSPTLTSTTVSFGSFGSWTPPRSVSASVTLIVP